MRAIFGNVLQWSRGTIGGQGSVTIVLYSMCLWQKVIRGPEGEISMNSTRTKDRRKRVQIQRTLRNIPGLGVLCQPRSLIELRHRTSASRGALAQLPQRLNS